MLDQIVENSLCLLGLHSGLDSTKERQILFLTQEHLKALTKRVQANLPSKTYINFSTRYYDLTVKQKQLLYECEEERMLTKACLRELIKLKRSPKHTSWDTADAANMGFT